MIITPKNNITPKRLTSISKVNQKERNLNNLYINRSKTPND